MNYKIVLIVTLKALKKWNRITEKNICKSRRKDLCNFMLNNKECFVEYLPSTLNSLLGGNKADKLIELSFFERSM